MRIAYLVHSLQCLSCLAVAHPSFGFLTFYRKHILKAHFQLHAAVANITSKCTQHWHPVVVITDSLSKNIPIQYVKLQVMIIIILQKMVYFDYYLLIIMFTFPTLSDLQFKGSQVQGSVIIGTSCLWSCSDCFEVMQSSHSFLLQNTVPTYRFIFPPFLCSSDQQSSFLLTLCGHILI